MDILRAYFCISLVKRVTGDLLCTYSAASLEGLTEGEVHP